MEAWSVKPKQNIIPAGRQLDRTPPAVAWSSRPPVKEEMDSPTQVSPTGTHNLRTESLRYLHRNFSLTPVLIYQHLKLLRVFLLAKKASNEVPPGENKTELLVAEQSFEEKRPQGISVDQNIRRHGGLYLQFGTFVIAQRFLL